MKFASLGYHTFSLFRRLTVEECETLLFVLFKLRDIGVIRIRPLTKNDDFCSNEFNEKLSSRSRYFLIEYPKRKDPTKNKEGLSWLVRQTPKSPGFISYLNQDVDRPCSIKARINPKLFTGEEEYIVAANASYLEAVEKKFNLEAAKISSIMGRFNDYEFNRIDFCVNFALRELGIDCDPLLIMELFRRSNIPKHFKRPWKPTNDNSFSIDGKTARIASPPADDLDRAKFILTSDSININCYWKHQQLRDNFIDCPSYEDSIDVIRFEVQCLYSKVYYLWRTIMKRDGATDLFADMLSDEISAFIIGNYFDKIIRPGDYYSMDEAIKKIEANPHVTKKTANRLIATLKEIDLRGGIANAKVAITKPEARENFRRSLRDLAALRINPVIIPAEYGVNHIPNLLETYYDKVSEEKNAQYEKAFRAKDCMAYVEEFGWPSD